MLLEPDVACTLFEVSILAGAFIVQVPTAAQLSITSTLITALVRRVHTGEALPHTPSRNGTHS
jgi:hypothetical protein